MILRQRIGRAGAQKGGKGGDRAWVMRFELDEGFGIGRHRRTCKFFGSERLVSAQRFAPAAQPEIADRAAIKSFRLLGGDRADADARAELLVDRFEPRRGVDRVAVSRVVKKPPAAEIADDRRSRMDPDARDAERDAARVPFAAVVFGARVEGERAGGANTISVMPSR